MKKSFVAAFLLFGALFADNQTATLSPVLPEDSLPFSIKIEQASFSLPTGLQAFASGIYDGKWILLAGRTNGLHGFDNILNNFPPNFQNTTVFVIDPETGTSWSRAFSDGSGLNQEEIDALSVTAAEFFQKGDTLYVVGGYGVNTATGEMDTKSTLTAIDLNKMTRWVVKRKSTAKKAIRQVSNPWLQVTGGALFQANDHQPFLLILGQNFQGLYRGNSNGIYTMQIRPFWLNDDGKKLSILPLASTTTYSDYRRRDLNIVPTIRDNKLEYVAYAGVFTLTDGVWTVPITIEPDGSSFEPSPLAQDSFKQAMNQYNCPTFGLYSSQKKEMYVLFPGGISFGFFSGGTFQTDSEFPFINQVTCIKTDKQNHSQQYIMNEEYPLILSTGSNPGNALLFGAEATFFPKDGIPLFQNGVIQLDALPDRPTVIGYIAGGIMSTLPNTNFITDSTSSPYVFTVTLIPRKPL